jgi:hypothetical protein
VGVRHPAVLDENENSRCNCPASQPDGEKGYGLSRIESFRRKTPGKRPGDDCRGAIRSESDGRRRKGRRPDEMECNLRGKRQDPWRKANDPAKAGCRPCGKRTGYVRISEVSGPGSERACWQAREGRAENPHPKAEGGDAGSRLRCGAGIGLQRPCRRAQRRETGSQHHSTG